MPSDMTTRRRTASAVLAVMLGSAAITGCHGGSSLAGAPVADGPAELAPPAHDPHSGGAATVGFAVDVQNGETFSPALHKVDPRLTPLQAWDTEWRHSHPGDTSSQSLPKSSQVRIGYLDVGHGRRLAYAFIASSQACAYTLAPPTPPVTCNNWDFLSTATGLEIAAGGQTPAPQ